jgi:hypothetical protein
MKEAPAARDRRSPEAKSERHVVVEFKIALRLAGRLAPAEELDFLGNDLAAVPPDIILVGSIRVTEPAANADQHALGRVLGDGLA